MEIIAPFAPVGTISRPTGRARPALPAAQSVPRRLPVLSAQRGTSWMAPVALPARTP